MRAPDCETDGWRLDDGEQRRRAHPATFEIPPLEFREDLEPGDFAQLIFVTAVVDGGEMFEEGERMWVIVRGRTPGGYIGVLNNEPFVLEGKLKLGSELAFEYRHIIDLNYGNAQSIAIARGAPASPSKAN